MPIAPLPATARRLRAALCLAACAALPLAALAQPAPEAAAPHNVFQLAATGQAQAPHDWLRLSLAAQREGADPASVQAELQRVVDSALQQLRPAAQGERLRVQTSHFGLYPRAGKNKGWVGRAELLLQGQDFALILQAAARASGLSVAHLEFDLSRQTRAQLEQQAQAQAIEQFKARAADITRAFGLSGYSLREISISGNDADAPAALFARQAATEEQPLDVEPGQAVVRVTVSGSVQGR